MDVVKSNLLGCTETHQSQGFTSVDFLQLAISFSATYCERLLTSSSPSRAVSTNAANIDNRIPAAFDRTDLVLLESC